MSNGNNGHNHTHGMARNSLRLAFFLTLIILIVELVGGLLANSLALLSDGLRTHVKPLVITVSASWQQW